ncbi:hypothetical protein QAD02_009356 [Eretmocerus hayati]|uniref:Uncharacterized protein n=1 Tax=Eretmocerus hayati TaxID=131215 RepID=A0ACC2N9U2_9HYME|nr:hypothetical protein QAD02_009356 [Eretmocerus hayati]
MDLGKILHIRIYRILNINCHHKCPTSKVPALWLLLVLSDHASPSWSRGGLPPPRHYLYRLMNLLNPFRTSPTSNGKPLDEPIAKASNHQPAQYAPRMPYTGGGYHYEPPPSPIAPSLAPTLPPNNNGYSSGLAAWMSGKTCNPCNQVPWVPIFRNDAHQGISQYAPNAGYQAPAPSIQGYNYPASNTHNLQQQQHHSAPISQSSQGPYPGVSPPVFDAKPFNTPALEYSSPGQLYHPPPPQAVPVNHQASYFDNPGSDNSHNFPPHSDESNQHHHHQPPEESDFPPGDIEDSGTLEHDGEHPPFGADVDYSQQSGSGLYDERPSGPEPEHAESRPVQVNNQPLTSHNLSPPSILPTRLFDPETGTSVHFQRSPLIDLTVAGESGHTTTTTTTTVRPVYRPSPGHQQSSREQYTRTTLSPSTVIEYMVSAGDISSSEEGRSAERWTTTTTRPEMVTTQKLFTTTRKELVDQKHQESRIETLVQSYEILRKSNRTSKEEEREEKDSQQLEQVTFNDTEDSSASKEVNVDDKPDNGKRNKQVIQIIIPYTSQYTASPFHPTRPAIIEESRRVSVTRHAPQRNISSSSPEANSIDVHRLQKNIDNWTIQEYSKSSASVTRRPNSTYPRWLSSKSIPDEYLLTVGELDESSEYYDFSNETKLQRGTNHTEDSQQYLESTTPEPTTQRVNIVTAIYSKSPKKYESPPSRAPPIPLPTPTFNRSSSEKVYVVTPVPISDVIASGSIHPNSLEQLYAKDESSKGKPQRDVEQAYQVLPQAVNNLAVLSSPPDSAAPVLWGIMEHEQLAASPDQPRWRSESDVLPEPQDAPVLYAGHSKVSV